MAPLVSAGIVMIWRRERARHYLDGKSLADFKL